ncbi:hypothetical protein CFR80_15670 [Komagataeibacter oboediens]|uniref:Uncharacterized protein n=1 Tax=Komagataeibacter oboediens TaxID=65958 RepID=A0A318QM38_9PROT|nr:hypothetical protein [Komagataeibacter oboediens]PYD79034.1 hypothetical protein CFR80_15670 [Komagataeibacter oboediens]
MDQALLQQKVARGYAKAALRLGATTEQYRPASLTAPMGTAYATMLAAFNADKAFGFQAPALWDKPAVFGLFDTTDVQSGDLLTCAGENYFVARLEPFRPPLCMLCNRVVSIAGQPGQGSANGDGAVCTDVGASDDYGTAGDTSAQTTLASGWPAFIQIKGKGSPTGDGIPGSIKAADYEMFLPLMPNFIPDVQMAVTTDLGTTYTLTAVEPSQYGNRCLMSVRQV